MISKFAIIDPSAKIAEDVTIGPFTIIGPEVEIDTGSIIGSHAVIKGPTEIGLNNKIFQFTSIGEDCQDKKYNGEYTKLKIGDNNIFREGCTVHRGTADDNSLTLIHNNNYFMAYTHIAHDCIIGSNIILSNNASIAGHVHIDDYAILGGFVGVHQFVKNGAHSFIAAGSIVTKDVSPYVSINSRHALKVYGLNTVGLNRRKFSNEVIHYIKKAYKIIFYGSTTVQDASEKLNELISVCPEIKIIRDFLLNSKRGITR